MGTNERETVEHRDLVHKKLRPWEILCEECGAIYDTRTEEGLCCHCAGDDRGDPGELERDNESEEEDRPRDC